MIYLTKRDGTKNMARFYALDLQPALFGEWALVKEWGRIGSAGQKRRVFYDEKAEADAALVRELKRRCTRQYVENSDL